VFTRSATYTSPNSAVHSHAFKEIVPLLMYRTILGFLTTAVLATICYAYLDRPLALAIANLPMHRQVPHLLKLPDLLLPFVAIVTLCASVGRLLLAGKPDREQLRSFLTSVAIVAPVSFIVKEACKFVFGRIETRKWLLNRTLDGFHWFNGVGYYNGFPSGHMMVFVALTAVLWRYYPRPAIYYALGLSGLGIALIVTDYHFLGDVVAGSYGGLLVERLFARSRVATI
jgi:membrane-associated phospholipid phosphatase